VKALPAYESSDLFSLVKWVCSHLCIYSMYKLGYIRFCSEIGFSLATGARVGKD
jgi:hypothetical protein